MNKNDIDPSKENEIKNAVTKSFKNNKIFSISALTGLGLDQLVLKMGTKVISFNSKLDNE